MKKFDLIFATILVPLDYLALVMAGLAAYSLRFADYFKTMRPIIFRLPMEQYTKIVLLTAIGWIVVYALSGLYTIGGRKRKLDEFKKIILASTAAFGGLLALVVFSREFFDSRFILLVSWGLAIIFVFIERLILRLIKNGFYRAGLGLKQVAVIGHGSSAQAVAEFLKRSRKFGFKIILRADAFTSDIQEKLASLTAKKQLDQIIAIYQNGGREELHQVLDFADEHHVPFRYSTDILTSHGAGLEFDTLAGVPIMEMKRTRLEGWGSIYKRIFDIVVSLVLIILMSPIILLVALATLIESGLPIIYRNERVGEHGKIFQTLKFRTMYKKYCTGKQFPQNKEALDFEQKLIQERSEKAGPVYKIKDDPRVTFVGRFLRRTSLDELPQLFNVLIGQMTLVGPRPHQTREVEQYEKHHKRVLEIKPGMTGLPQISGRSDLSFEEEVRLDTYYIEHWSLKLDLIILFKTPLMVLAQKGTY